MRVRLDIQLVASGLAETREKARRLVLAGAVRVDGQLAHKPAQLVEPSAAITVDAGQRYVSRGGYKLAAALQEFNVCCKGLVCADIGASTGGFTDCLLQGGATRVYAVDVGKGQLAWRLRQDPRVVVREETNARYLDANTLGVEVDLVTIDVSFISLTKVLPSAKAILKSGGILVALIKPQFEAGKKLVERGGVVRDSSVHQAVIKQVVEFGKVHLGLEWLGTIESPLLGPAGNKEFLTGFRKP